LLTKAQSELATQAQTIALQALAIESAQAQLRAGELHAQNVARQVEAESRRLNAVLEATPVGIFVTDAHGRLISTNPANRVF
jgi:PAS domain-containing protein